MKKRIFVTAVDKKGQELRKYVESYDEMFTWLNTHNLKVKRTRTQYVYIGQVHQKSKK